MCVLGGPNSPDESLVTHASDHGITAPVLFTRVHKNGRLE